MIRLTRRALFAFSASLLALNASESRSWAQQPPIEPIDTTPTPDANPNDQPVTEATEVATPDDTGAVTAAGRYFGDTGHNLKDPFLAKWQITGGRDGIGAPICEERFVDGIGVCQSFDAVTMVFDPGLEAPWDVQSLHIPDETRRSLAPGSARTALSAAPKGSGRFFADSGHSLSGKFLDFWEDHGDLPLIGLPTSEPFLAKSIGMQTQVFERAVLEIAGGKVRFQPIASRLAESDGSTNDPAFAPNPPIAGTTQLVKSPDGLRLRAAPSLDADIIAVLPDNAEFIAAAAESGDWYAGYADGYAGYVSSQFLKQAPSLPAISLAEWDTTVWQGAALGETNLRSKPDTNSNIVKVLEYGDDVVVTQWVKGEEVFTGADLWAKTNDGLYLYGRNVGRNAPVAAPPLPANAPSTGKWIDVNLTQQLMVAYEGTKVARVVVTTTGMAGWETPTGSYSIINRVANETMESKSIGAENYFKLEDVLYTQYFTDLGHAIHYAWWRTPQTIGRPGSHGCLNTLLDDATYFWNWANYGTPVIVHY